MTTRIASLLIFALVAITSLGNFAQAGPSLVMDLDSGKIISQDRAGESWYPASITKLMTAYLTFEALKQGELQLEQKILVSKRANSMPASKIGFAPGSQVSVDLVLQSLLVYSANDMAVVLAEAVAGSEKHFVARMNARARQFGMTATHFVNPNGLFAEGQVSSARDIAILARKLYQDFPEARHYYKQPDVVIGKKRLRNRNLLLRQMPNAEGMKTGYVCKAGFNLVAIASGKGRRLLAVVLGADGGQTRANWAQRILTESFFKPTTNQSVRDIVNLNNKPADMSGEVCQGQGPATVSVKKLQGWGISLGQYGSRSDAQRFRKMLNPGENQAQGDGQEGEIGIIRLPGKEGYGLYVWGLTAQQAQNRCQQAKNMKIACEVRTPEDFAFLAAKLPNPKQKPNFTADPGAGSQK